MERISNICKWFVIVFAGLMVLRGALVGSVEIGEVGVRRSNIGGVVAKDLEPGWRLEILGLHKIIDLPSTYQFLGFLKQDALEIRTKDNNIVTLDISVPYRIKPGEAWEIVSAGNHVKDGESYRYQRLTRETTVGVLREHLAALQSSDFYDTDRRNVVAATALERLNEELGALHVEANTILIRAVYFRGEYEKQLLQIQLNAQNKLLDGARKGVADKQQTLDNFQQKTRALASAREQKWVASLARIDRAYQVGFLRVNPADALADVAVPDSGLVDPSPVNPDAENPDAENPDAEDPAGSGPLAGLSLEELAELEALAAESAAALEPGAARRRLETLSAAQRSALQMVASVALGGEPEGYGDNYLLGIKNIEAETLAYDKSVRAGADGVSARLGAEGDALVAEVMGGYEGRVNSLLNSPAGRAFVAWQAAANVTFASDLTFQSTDGVPSVLRLREFAEAFMGE